MLAPGELLTTPPPSTEAMPAQAGERPAEPGPQTPEAAKPGEPEPESFLMILLRALGAVHT
jgi:hypothetical protein